MLLFIILIIAILLISVVVILINKKNAKKTIKPDIDAYGASFGDCSLDLEEMRKKAQEKKDKPQQ
ncbi:hypothetical protein DESAMIL20_1246 [Desulfurella amilsii]|uniref:Uncharacterized protein n=1 Tax=Desulfurella amilsii TaxID=1562698 RepID=A0A1X4XVX1_9BACT|nr:hypothetical protein [Desulfurella amilsii]OSS41693.1 hypothetical protein DESAMIL20_1246 [Desulfurella amilsii]